jgi:hypothetical protein
MNNVVTLEAKFEADIVGEMTVRAKSLWLLFLKANGAADNTLPAEAESFLDILVPALAKAAQGKALLRAAVIVEQAMASGDIMREGHPIGWLHREATALSQDATKAMKAARETLAAA